MRLNKLISFLLILALLFSSTSVVSAASPSHETKVKSFVDELNYVRKAAGVRPLTTNPFLTKAVDNHGKYLQWDQNDSFTEVRGRKGFTGETLYDRLEYVGYTMDDNTWASHGSVLYGEVLLDSLKEEVHLYLADPEVRINLLDPDHKSIGVSIGYGLNVLTDILLFDFLSEHAQHDAPVVYPYQGAKSVPVKGDPFHERQEEGYAISFVADEWVEDHKATLKDSKGNHVPFTEEDNGYLILYPKNKLKHNEKYTVTVSYSGTSKTWSFTTERDMNNLPSFGDWATYRYEPWMDDMLWSIEKELIAGYPGRNGASDTIRPYLTLSEGQALTVLYRYFEPRAMKSTKPRTKWSASVAYQLAEKDRLNTLGSFKNVNAANKGITRGKLAELMASLHYGRNVSEREAVQFMYDAGISDGYSDPNGNIPKTYESFGTKDILKRYHISAFMKRYDDFKNKR